MTDQVIVTLEKGVQILTINRPERKNALNAAMYHALADNIDRAETDPNIRVTLITGTGDAFTTGSDVGLFAATNAAPPSEPDPHNPFPPSLMAAKKPVVAAVNGFAVGLGVTMLLHCDLVYAAKSATFQMPFVKLGLLPEFGSTVMLPRLVGLQKATELLFLSKRFTAEEAKEMGLVAEVFSDSELASEALTRAQAIAALAPNAVKITKALLRDADRQAVKAQVEAEDALFFPQLRSSEATEAISAFFEKRPADYSKVS